MKKNKSGRKSAGGYDLIWMRGKKKGEKAQQAFMKELEGLSDRMGLLDPWDVEPAVIFSTGEVKK